MLEERKLVNNNTNKQIVDSIIIIVPLQELLDLSPHVAEKIRTEVNNLHRLEHRRNPLAKPPPSGPR